MGVWAVWASLAMYTYNHGSLYVCSHIISLFVCDRDSGQGEANIRMLDNKQRE